MAGIHVDVSTDTTGVLTQVEFHGVAYTLTTYVQESGNLTVEIEQRNEASRWRGEFTPQCKWSSGATKSVGPALASWAASQQQLLLLQMLKISAPKQAITRSLLCLCGCWPQQFARIQTAYLLTC